MLNAIEQKQLARFERLMSIPKWKYILLFGVIGWGLPVAIIVSIINMVFQHFTWKDIYLNLITFPIAGIIYGFFMRKFIPRQIGRLKEKENADY